MQIQGVAHQQAWQLLKTRQDGPQTATEKAPKPQNTATPAPIETEPKPAELSTDQEQEKGVIRLLREGHFQGVADLRLRINFHEELQQAATREAQETWASEGQELVSTLNGKIEELGNTFAFSEEVAGLMDNFEQATSPLFSGTTDGPFDATAAMDEMTKAFNGLIDALQAFKPTATDESSALVAAEDGAAPNALPATEEPAIATADAPATDPLTGENSSTTPAALTFTDALANLQQWFDTEKAALDTMLAETRSLPELSAPRGKGVAYERFLAMYNSLQTPTSTTGTETGGSEPEGIQTEA
jgi:hypothetical protein